MNWLKWIDWHNFYRVLGGVPKKYLEIFMADNVGKHENIIKAVLVI